MKKAKNENCAIIICPPLSTYALPPSDHSASEPIDCPRCKQKMWISIKKKAVIKLCEETGKEIIMNCYDCFLIIGAALAKKINMKTELSVVNL